MGPLRASFVVVLVCACVLFDTCEGHVALTFPPSRKYDLDFLDNSRTKAPCGMPKGNIKTSLLSGSKLNVTWHLGYPHKGGFKLQLLDNLERPILDLTPTVQGSEFVSNDATAQSYQVQLPNDYTCNDCTLRLIRQALEWGNNYKFWSCADVDIKSRKDYKETCSSHGKSLVGRCKCDRLYYGDRCQYKDECWENSDCGDHGKCIHLQGTTTPRQQCYCDLGWFGVGCNKKSPVKTTEIDFGLYTERKLSDTFRLYWRILKEHKEIEVVLVVNGTSYAAIGWRPSSLTSSCKNFPLIGPPATQNMDLEGKPEPNSEPEPLAEPKPEPEPTAEPKAEPIPVPEPKSKVELVPELKNEPEPKSEPQSTFEPDPVTTTISSKYKKSYSRRSASASPRVLSGFDDADIVETSVSFKVSSKQGRRKRRSDSELPLKPLQKYKESNVVSDSPGQSEVEPTPEPKSDSESTREPKSELQATPESKAEPEPTTVPKSEPEPSAEPKSKPEPSAEPSAEPKPKPEPSSEPNSKPETKVTKSLHSSLGASTTPKEPLNPYTPRHDFNPMDCTDIVIGSARNMSSRISDYYTRDRSTPQMDNFWGGKIDLTAAMGFEKDGITTILFRRKLEANEPSDHTIENNLMHLIWAQGQESGKYIHVPKSGVETSDASVKDFYKPDELKYHGHGSQRGFSSINFYDEKKTVELDSRNGETISRTNSVCGGEWKTPHACSLANNTCEYCAKWEYLPRRDEIRFSITTKYSQYWTGIGFSNNEKMSQTDAILGWVDKSGRPFLMDTWITGYTAPMLDSSQEIFNISGRVVDGITTLSFIRKRISNDPKDLSFTNENCLFMMYPVKGGIFNGVNKKIRKHEAIPTVSVERICIRSCGNDNWNDDLTTPEPPALGYNMQVKIVNLGENFHVPEVGSSQYDELSNTINQNFKSLFNKVPGFQKVVVQNFEEHSNKLLVMMHLQLDKTTIEKGRSLTENDEQQRTIKALLQNVVESGRVGALQVDPDFWRFEAESVTSNVVQDTSEHKDSFFNLPGIKFYIVLGCLAALVLLAVIQASCTLYKTTRKSHSQKDHLLQNSAWKDYSTASTNYAFDAFENDENQHRGRARSETLPARNQPRSGRPQGPPPSVPTYLGDTRSLQRSRGSPAAGPQLERSTLSLPRTSYDRNRQQVHDNNGSLHPDFYFMPSQRKYSGEVVRVYVDYNNKLK